ncbi:MAG: ParB/RepB/Spo0J family partition protein [Lachnospiraceae bacterium]|nr:ParB/RepB/Spo0J family partition protein [Lachnospiraceae bacterium]
MAVKRGLGKGLDSIIPQAVVKPVEKEQKNQKVSEDTKLGEAITMVKIGKLKNNEDQPRKKFDDDAIEELSESIKQYGIITPLVVQDRKTYYEIIAGERRWRAAMKAGLKEVPVIVKNYSELEIAEISLIENIQREDLNPIEEALAYKRLIEEFKLKQDEVAERVSKSRTAVTNSMRLLKLGPNVQQMVIDDQISTGHARALISVEDLDKQYELAQQVFDEKLSVRDIEKLVKNLGVVKVKKNAKNVDKSLQAIYDDITEKLKQKLNTKVSITPSNKNDGAGKLEIEFYSHDELEKIMDLLNKAK